MAARGCGDSRNAGGIYIECPLSPFGMPLEHFLVDPPIPVNADELGLSPIGVKFIERNGVWHVMDWVGSVHYPNVSDFVEEVRRLGLSRRIASNSDFGKLTSESRILLVHSRAFIKNHQDYYNSEPPVEELEGLVPYPECPKHLEQHNRPTEQMCARLWYQDVEGGTLVTEDVNDTQARRRCVTRKMPSFDYHALQKPEGLESQYQTAIFASMPISNLAVIRDPEGRKHEKALESAEKAKLPVKLLDE